MKTATTSRAILLISALALFLVHPLILHGCSCGHDIDFHLLSWFEAATQISHGNLHPHWAFTPAWDAGEPRFVFYPPLSWYLGALIGTVFVHLPELSQAAAWTAAPTAFIWAALTLSGWAMFRFARRYLSAGAALVASAIYMANPYMLFTAFERAAYGELLAAAWIPLLLEGILRERISAARIAVPVALLWLTNAPAGVMGCYALALVAFVRLAVHVAAPRPEIYEPRSAWTARFAIKAAGGVVLGLALAAFYILPAAYERRYVQAAMATIGGMRIDQNFLFQHTGTTPDDLLHDQVLNTASWIAVSLLTLTAAALFAVWLRRRKSPRPNLLAPLAALTAAIALLLTPVSAPLWQRLPEMVFLQFSWRLLAVLAPVCSLAIVAALSPRSLRQATATLPSIKAIFAALLIAAALGLPAYHLFRQSCDPDDTAAARLALFRSNAGTDPTDEYTPVAADNDSLKPGEPAWWLANSAGADSIAPANNAASRTAPMRLNITAQRPEFLVLNLRDYPAWRITLARHGSAPQLLTSRAPRVDGLIALPVPAGESTIDVRYAETPDQITGNALSLAALALLAIASLRRRSSKHAEQPA